MIYNNAHWTTFALVAYLIYYGKFVSRVHTKTMKHTVKTKIRNEELNHLQAHTK